MSVLVKSQAKDKSLNQGQVALKAFFNLVNKWQLSDEQKMILLGTPFPDYILSLERWAGKSGIKRYN